MFFHTMQRLCGKTLYNLSILLRHVAAFVVFWNSLTNTICTGGHACDIIRYMKYATAVYGETMIRAAEMDVLGKFDNRFSAVTRTRISEHCNIPEEHIVLMDIDYGGNVSLGLILFDRQDGHLCFALLLTYCLRCFPIMALSEQTFAAFYSS
jgi:hypothetical protein